MREARLSFHILKKPSSPHNTTDYLPDMFPFSCFLRCLSKLVCWPKHLSHKWHLKGFSLLWMLRTCRCKLEDMLKDLSQYLHLKNKHRECLQGNQKIFRKNSNPDIQNYHLGNNVLEKWHKREHCSHSNISVPVDRLLSRFSWLHEKW